jgi:hypothetical protein
VFALFLSFAEVNTFFFALNCYNYHSLTFKPNNTEQHTHNSENFILLLPPPFPPPKKEKFFSAVLLVEPSSVVQKQKM